MTLSAKQTPSEQERVKLLREIGPLPLRGMAWPNWVKALAWVVLVIIAIQIIRTAASPIGHDVNPVLAGGILICFFGLVVVARFMLTSETRITRVGIEQSWITRRKVSWEEIQSAKFTPLLASKRLICFVGAGRPVVFQAGTRELQAAFARIALIYQKGQ